MSKLRACILIYSLCLATPAYAVDGVQAILGTQSHARTVATADTHTLKLLPYKNELFAYAPLLSTHDQGNYLEFEFDEMRDVNGRDEIPVKKALNKFVEITPKTQSIDRQFNFPGGSIVAAQTGETAKAKFAVIFVHGGGGTKELGINDWTFGGNFNRLKHLSLQNGGVYFSPSVSFDMNGILGVSEIIKQIKISSPKAQVVVACGSAGSFICWGLLTHSAQTKNITGLVILGGAIAPTEQILKAAVDHQIALTISHGTNDRVLGWNELEKAYNAVKDLTPSNFILFRNGGHGTPIRMIDWYQTLNWNFKVKANK